MRLEINCTILNSRVSPNFRKRSRISRRFASIRNRPFRVAQPLLLPLLPLRKGRQRATGRRTCGKRGIRSVFDLIYTKLAESDAQFGRSNVEKTLQNVKGHLTRRRRGLQKPLYWFTSSSRLCINFNLWVFQYPMGEFLAKMACGLRSCL